VDDSIPVVKGTLDLLVLKALMGGPAHGFEVASWIETHSGGEVTFDDSAIYHALYRMEKRGLVEAEWGVTENNRRARYYKVTALGRAHLREESERVLRFARTLAAILESGPGPR
jgi:PadR family transcriptional regulator PadR